MNWERRAVIEAEIEELEAQHLEVSLAWIRLEINTEQAMNAQAEIERKMKEKREEIGR